MPPPLLSSLYSVSVPLFLLVSDFFGVAFA
jgi:hypothetical protein